MHARDLYLVRVARILHAIESQRRHVGFRVQDFFEAKATDLRVLLYAISLGWFCFCFKAFRIGQTNFEFKQE
jgi:hypothetical protein